MLHLPNRSGANRMHRALVACLITLLVILAAPAHAITLEQSMADPDWIGASVEDAYWSVDGRSLYYRAKQTGSSIRDLHRIDLADGKDTIVDPQAMASADGADPVFDRTHTRAAFVRNGDVFIRDVASGRLTQVTRTPQPEASPQFSADGRVLHYRSGSDWFMYDIASGVSGLAAIVVADKDPDAKKPDDLGQMQLRYFSTLREIKADHEAHRKHDAEFAKGDPTRAPQPFHIGDDVKIEATSLSPDGRSLLVVTSPKRYDAGKRGKLQRFVTESGYEEREDERTRVGRNDPAPQSLLLLDLTRHEQHALGVDDLPGIHDDPLQAVREENGKATHDRGDDAKADKTTATAAKKDDKKDGKPKLRAVRIVSRAEDGGGGGIEWSEDGRSLAIQIRAIDNKDRWIASVDFGAHRLVNQSRLTDPAWINWNFNEFGWEKDNRTLWYVSEETGYAQLYAKMPGGKASALTHGQFEVSAPVQSPDGQWFYLRTNAEAPYAYDVYRVAIGGGTLDRVTSFKGMDTFELSPDGSQLAVLHSSAYVPPQLAVVAVAVGGAAAPRELTDTRTPQYKALPWPALDIVEVPSSHTQQPIYAKLYKPKDFDPSKKYPAVLFVHGAGYLQNVLLGYSYYFREQMFNNMLTEHGYVVLDMDYRASEGYGRAWRTAIYRDMGHPELEDLIDGVHWLEKTQSVDPARVGLYGGSYGGFMALMALFRASDVFKAGAALRPVTDWTQYNHEYTSNILNDPQIDPIAYARSSPMEFADGLKSALLICHGMIDNNVLFEDTVRLHQKLIELHKDNYEVAAYPMERHGFVHADSWLDEYKRIFKLFEANLK
jgi:dipeptidyl aminopeptidase/acylaminoacyl peptidase